MWDLINYRIVYAIIESGVALHDTSRKPNIFSAGWELSEGNIFLLIILTTKEEKKENISS